MHDLDTVLARTAALTKHDFELMDFQPEDAANGASARGNISSAFIWEGAPGGTLFWRDARGRYNMAGRYKPPNLNAQIILHAMLKRHNELYGENNNDNDR